MIRTRAWVVVALLGGCCPAASSSGPAWPASAGPLGDIDRDDKDAWQEDGGTSVDPANPQTASEIENARLGPPPASVSDEDFAWGEVDWDDDDDEAVDLDDLLNDDGDDDGATVDGGELVIEL